MDVFTEMQKRLDEARDERARQRRERALTVGKLIQRLQKLDPEMRIATHANNHTAAGMSESMRVGILRHYEGDFCCIGNFYQRDLNPPNWFILSEADGGDALPASIYDGLDDDF